MLLMLPCKCESSVLPRVESDDGLLLPERQLLRLGNSDPSVLPDNFIEVVSITEFAATALDQRVLPSCNSILSVLLPVPVLQL